MSLEENRENYYVLKTLGCKANLYDSQLIEAELQKRGWFPLPAQLKTAAQVTPLHPRLCIVNSCTVTDEADRQSRKMASRLSRENPEARVVVTGCGAEVDPERLARSKGIHYVVGNQSKPRMVDLIFEKLAQEQSEAQAEDSGERRASGQVLGSVSGYEEMLSRHPTEREWPATEDSFFTPPTGLQGHSGKTRAFLKIQEGCNSFCTYCIIPYGRGPSRSLRPREAVEQVRELVSQGIREVVITGTNVGDYGVDWGLDPNQALAELFELILAETGLERLRVSSLDPTEVTPALLSLMAREPRFCPHFHVSLQAARDRTLKLMKRKYQMDQVRTCLQQIAALPAPAGGPFVGMDLITGFPGETDEEFEASFEELSKLPWSRLHVFPYSERSGTPATRLPGAVRQELRVLRTRRLNELSLERLNRHYREALEVCQKSGQALQGILLEKPTSKAPLGFEARGTLWANGYTPNYLRVLIPMTSVQAESLRNTTVSAMPMELAMDSAAGEVVLVSRLQ